MGDTPRVLVLGSAGHPPPVTSRSWRGVSAGVNPSDYDVVILNYVLSDGQYAASLPADGFQRMWMRTETEVILIAAPGRVPLGDNSFQG